MISAPITMTIETFRLRNGLDVILAPDRSTPLAAVSIWYRAGSAREQPGTTGIAHLLEHAMFQGSAHVPAGGHASLLDKAGGEFNGRTGTDRTSFFQTFPSSHLEQVLWLESDRMGFFIDSLRPADLDRQRRIIRNERQLLDDAPYGSVPAVLARLLHPDDHPYSWPPIGTPEDLEAITIEATTTFFRKHFRPDNASIAIAGNFDPDEAAGWIERYFGSIPPDTLPGTPPPVQIPPAQVGESYHELILPVRYPRLYIAWRSPSLFAADEAALTLLADVLAGSRIARLTRRLVHEERIAHRVAANQLSRELSGQFTISVDLRQPEDAGRVVALVMAELETLALSGPTDSERNGALARLEVSTLRDLETLLGRAESLNWHLTFGGDAARLSSSLSRFEAVSLADLATAARLYLGRDRLVLLTTALQVDQQAEWAPSRP